MRGLRSTLVLLVIAVGLGIYIYVDADRAPAGTANALETVFDFESDDVARISVLAENGDETVIQKAADRWGLVAPFEGNVDVPAVVGLASSLAGLEMQRVVAEPEDAIDLSTFGLTSPRITVGVATTTGGDSRLLLGERTPTGGDVYATIDESNRVFLISGYLDDTFNQTTFDLRDKTILEFNSDQVESLAIAGGEAPIELQKTDNRWSLVSPLEAHADFGVTNGIVGRLSTGQIASVEVERADDLTPFGLDAPRLTVTVGLDSSTAILLIGNDAPGGLVYARDLARDPVFTVDQSLVDELEQGAGEFRRKDLFTFRPFNATRVEIDRSGDRWVFEKGTTETEDGSQTWRRTAPSTKELDTAAMDDLLAKLSNLRANEFVSSQDGTGLEAPAVNISVAFDEGDQERVAVGRVNDDVFGVIGIEPGAARLDTRAWDAAMAALEALD